MTQSLEYVFDRMGKGKGEIKAAFDSFIKFGNAALIGAYEGGLAFQSKRNIIQLQAADMIACGAGRHMNNRVLRGRPEQGDPWFEDIMSLKPRPENRYFDRQNLTEWVAKMEKHKDEPNWGTREI